MINKSDSRCAVVRFCYHSYDYRPNWTPLSPITITYLKPGPMLDLFLVLKLLSHSQLVAKPKKSDELPLCGSRFRAQLNICFYETSKSLVKITYCNAYKSCSKCDRSVRIRYSYILIPLSCICFRSFQNHFVPC